MPENEKVLTRLLRDACIVVAIMSIIIAVLAFATDVNWRGVLIGQIVFVLAYTVIHYLRLTKRIRW